MADDVFPHEDDVPIILSHSSVKVKRSIFRELATKRPPVMDVVRLLGIKPPKELYTILELERIFCGQMMARKKVIISKKSTHSMKTSNEPPKIVLKKMTLIQALLTDDEDLIAKLATDEFRVDADIILEIYTKAKKLSSNKLMNVVKGLKILDKT